MHSFVSFLAPLPSGRPFFAYPGRFLAHRLVLGIPVLGCIPSIHCLLVPTTLPALHNPCFLENRLLYQWQSRLLMLSSSCAKCQPAGILSLRAQTAIVLCQQ